MQIDEHDVTEVTIIVCTRNRVDALHRCLASISETKLQSPSAKAELVVVDNGSTDNTRALVSRWLRSAPLPGRLVEERRPGKCAALNTGVRNARGRLIAFVDDDCCVAPNYLSDMLRHFNSDRTPAIRGGRVELGDPTDLPLGIKVDDAEVRFQYPMHPGLIALGCNMVIHRDVFARLGPFDERFGPGALFKSSEETEFFYRAYLSNVPVIYVPDMVVYHFHGRKTLDLARAHYWNYPVGNGAVYAKYLFAGGGLHKHIYWDLRKTIREIVRRNGFDEQGLFSQPFVMLQIFKGMALFYVTSTIAKVRGISPRRVKYGAAHMRARRPDGETDHSRSSLE
jgi:glycosyltransferase involved in cell wall biosynthesis